MRLLVLLLAVIGPAYSNITKSIDLSRSDEDKDVVQNTCQRIHSGETQILSIGRLLSSYLILTTDLFIFELPLEQVDPSWSSFTIVINEQPKHLRSRFPRSYPALEKVSKNIISSAVMSLQGQTGPTESYEYILFGYQNKTQLCLLAIDVRQDKSFNGPCVKTKRTLRFVSRLPSLNLGVLLIPDEPDKPQSYSFFYQLALARKMPVKGDKDIFCASMDSCKFVMILNMTEIASAADDGSGNAFAGMKISEFSINGGRLVAGFLSSEAKVHLVDDQRMVHSLENQLDVFADFVKTPLSNFIGCYVSKPKKFKIDPTMVIIIVVVFVVVEMAIVGGVFYSITSIKKATKGKDLLVDDERKTRKSKRMKTKSSKSCSSISSSVEKSASRSSKSRQSQPRASKGASSGVSLGSVAVSKRRGSLISGKSVKSRASKSQHSSKHSRSKGPTTSVSKRYSPSTASKKGEASQTGPMPVS